MASKFKQDMPPPGGYSPIEWAKRVPKPGWGGYRIFAGMGAVIAFGWTCAFFEIRAKSRYSLEENDARNALEPLILAEQHRMYLRQLRKNRDEEAELMKDVAGWEVGKFEGEPVYWNQANRFHFVHAEEYYMHSRFWDMYKRMYERQYH